MHITTEGYAELQPMAPAFKNAATLPFANSPAFNWSNTTSGYAERHMSVPDCEVNAARESLTGIEYKAVMIRLFQANI